MINTELIYCHVGLLNHGILPRELFEPNVYWVLSQDENLHKDLISNAPNFMRSLAQRVEDLLTHLSRFDSFPEKNPNNVEIEQGNSISVGQVNLFPCSIT